MDVKQKVEEIRSAITAAEGARRWQEADRLYQQLLPLVKKDAQLVARHARVVFQSGDAARAATMTRKAMRMDPDDVQLMLQLGELYQNQRRHDEAEAMFRRVIERDAGSVEGMRRLAQVIQTDPMKHEEAEKLLLRVLELAPDSVAAATQLGAIYASDPTRMEQAAEIFERSLERTPNAPSVVHNYGLLKRFMGELDVAEKYLRRACELYPGSVDFLFSLGICYLFMEELEQALETFKECVRRDPNHNASQVYVAFSLMLMGRHLEGWQQYEKRLRLKELKDANFDRPKWDGEPLEGRTILLLSEQGMGDNIQFVRYAEMVAARGGTVIVITHSSLRRLFESLRGVAHVVNAVPEAKHFHRYCPLMSLPAVFRTDSDTVPAEIPYLQAPEQLIAQWRQRLETHPGLRVGLNWRGNPKHVNDHFRSSSLTEMAQLLDEPGISFFCLQKSRPEEERVLPEGLIDLTDDFEDFADTAAAMASLDLVISVDTSLCHLAGAVGRPVWTMLPRGPDFRWGLRGETTPWYPTMKLYRQEKLGDWAPVYARMRHDLQALAGG